jgi:hypothetical protein
VTLHGPECGCSIPLIRLHRELIIRGASRACGLLLVYEHRHETQTAAATALSTSSAVPAGTMAKTSSVAG